ncbi:MAG TPA: hypothetical protein VMR74_06710 [Gammaproteobacteria bacterium]|nr:hypothetical protein [Gammaproteobacteria bacterium]
MRSLRAILLLFPVFLLLFPVFAAAEDATMIEWSPARPLAWDDFQGAVPSGAAPERVAAANTSLSWSYAYEVEWSRGTCTFRIMSIESAAGFHPEGSWARPNHRTPDVLLHEQGHFDITRLHYVEFVERTRGLIGDTRECRGSSERRAKRNAESEIARLAGTVYEGVWREYRREQEAYDDETRHGIDTGTQAEWTRRIAERLGRTD